MSLPFHPWWHHPNHNYVGKHRGRYQYVKPAHVRSTTLRMTVFPSTAFDLPDSITIRTWLPNDSSQ